MSEARKISVRKMMQMGVTILVTGACLIAILSAARMQDVKKLQGYDITIKNQQFSFVDKEDIKDMLVASSNVTLDKMSMGKLDAHKMEGIVNANPWVAGSQVYVGNDKMVHITVTQRVPVARLFDQAGNSYYLDRSLKAMPLSDKYIHYTTVVTNVPVLNNDSTGNSLKAQIVAVVNKIERDSFWAAQVSQIIVTDDRTFELVPVLGEQRILLGDTSMLNDKFDNLLAFYKKVANRIGWDKYEVLDVRYKGQVVASPAIAWKVPVDKAVSNMNWVKSIIGNDQPDVVADMAMPVPAAKAAATTVSAASAVTATATSVPAKPVTVATATVKQTTATVVPATVKTATPVIVTKHAVKPAATKSKEVSTAKAVVSKPKAVTTPVHKEVKMVAAAKAVAKKPEVKVQPKKVENKATEKKKDNKQTKEKEEPKPRYLYKTQ